MNKCPSGEKYGTHVLTTPRATVINTVRLLLLAIILVVKLWQ